MHSQRERWKGRGKLSIITHNLRTVDNDDVTKIVTIKMYFYNDSIHPPKHIVISQL